MSNLVKPLTWLFGVVLTLVGLAGFFTGSDMLLMFQVDMMHNIVHLLSGLIALFAASKGEAYARMYLQVFGVVYGLVTILGFWRMDVILFPVNAADNYLHLAIAAVCLIVGFGGAKRPAMV